jgi:hypothetical protein
MVALRLIAASAALIALAVPAEARSYLLSIGGVHLAPDRSVESFDLNTWGVRFKAVCRIPRDWEISAWGAGIAGKMSGQAMHGTVYIRAGNWDRLTALALVELSDPVQRTRKGNVPATFGGSVSVYAGSKDRSHKVPLTYANVRLTPAASCP